MSWDLFVQHIPTHVNHVREIPDGFRPEPLGRRSEIIGRILDVVPTADFSDQSWGSFEGEDFSVEFSMGDGEEVDSFALHVRGGETAAGFVADLLTRCGWRALDPASETGIFDPQAASAGLAKWRAYRDRIIGRTEPEGLPPT